MITKFKIFENIKSKAKIGDFVVCDPIIRNAELRKFFNIRIGSITEIYKGNFFGKSAIQYDIKFDFSEKDIEFINPKIGSNETIRFYETQIKYWSKNREDLEEILAAEKYNL